MSEEYARANGLTILARVTAYSTGAVDPQELFFAPIEAVKKLMKKSGTKIGDYDLICLTSPNGVRLLFARLAAEGRDARALAGARVAAIGPGTSGALRERGVIADIVPERLIAEGLVEALAELEAPVNVLGVVGATENVVGGQAPADLARDALDLGFVRIDPGLDIHGVCSPKNRS